jgi:hypothetical protein
VAFAREVAKQVGAGVAVLGIVERFHVSTGSFEFLVRVHYKDVVVVVSSFQVIDVTTGQRLLSDSARVALRATAAQPHQLPNDDALLREATRRVAAEIAQKIAVAWARWTGQLTIQIAQAVVARNVERDADFRLRPVGVSTSFPASSLRIVAYVSATGAKSDQRLDFSWYGPDNREYAKGTVVVPEGQAPDQPFTAQHAIRPPAGGLFPNGNWRLEIRVDGYLVRVITFVVTEG